MDELKLVDGKLDRALRGLAKVVDGHTHRARVIISCRPSDWRPHLDLTTVRDRLPVRARRRETPFRSPEEVFLEALRREGRETAGAHRGEEAPMHQGTVRTVAMLPMSDQQIRLFVEEMQRTLAWRIKERANGAYAVTREDEVADGKRTDVRLSAVDGAHRAVIEVKIADNGWSLIDLERALRNQLAGQYLRHPTCKAGCLLLSYHGRKRFRVHPETRKRIGFSEVAAFLRDRARAIEQETSHDVRLEVFGLDLTDPPFVPAHRGSESPELSSSDDRPRSPCTSSAAPLESRPEE